MKRFILYLSLLLNIIYCTSCSLKHKWHTKQKEKISRKKQEQIEHLLISEHVILDTSFQYAHTQLKNYRLWTLTGNVKIDPDGSLHTDQAILQSWHSETDSQHVASRNITYQTQKQEDQTTIEETTNLNRESTHKEKRKATTNLWWLLLLVIPLGILFTRRRWLLSR